MGRKHGIRLMEDEDQHHQPEQEPPAEEFQGRARAVSVGSDGDDGELAGEAAAHQEEIQAAIELLNTAISSVNLHENEWQDSKKEMSQVSAAAEEQMAGLYRKNKSWIGQLDTLERAKAEVGAAIQAAEIARLDHRRRLGDVKCVEEALDLTQMRYNQLSMDPLISAATMEQHRTCFHDIQSHLNAKLKNAKKAAKGSRQGYNRQKRTAQRHIEKVVQLSKRLDRSLAGHFSSRVSFDNQRQQLESSKADAQLRVQQKEKEKEDANQLVKQAMQQLEDISNSIHEARVVSAASAPAAPDPEDTRVTPEEAAMADTLLPPSPFESQPQPRVYDRMVPDQPEVIESDPAPSVARTLSDSF